MINSYESLGDRFPILDTVIKYLSCTEQEKQMLRELFLTIYTTGYEDGQRASR
jgi:hypothetical protein